MTGGGGMSQAACGIHPRLVESTGAWWNDRPKPGMTGGGGMTRLVIPATALVVKFHPRLSFHQACQPPRPGGMTRRWWNSTGACGVHRRWWNDRRSWTTVTGGGAHSTPAVVECHSGGGGMTGGGGIHHRLSFQ